MRWPYDGKHLAAVCQENRTLDWEAIFATRAGRMRASEIRELLKLLEQPDIISFAGGIPDPAL